MLDNTLEEYMSSWSTLAMIRIKARELKTVSFDGKHEIVDIEKIKEHTLKEIDETISLLQEIKENI